MDLDLEIAYGFEIDLELIKQMLGKRKTFKKIIPYPKIIRDLNLKRNSDYGKEHLLPLNAYVFK